MTGQRIELRVDGMPRPQGSHVGFVDPRSGRVIVKESSDANHRAWRKSVRFVAEHTMAGRPPFSGPLTVQMTFALPRPKSHPKGRRTWPTKRPDADKLARAVGDALTGAVWVDDSQVVFLGIRKQWALVDTPGPPGVHVVVVEVDS